MKKVIMLLGFAMFSMATFAAENVKNSSNSSTGFKSDRTEIVKNKVSSIIEKLNIEKNVTNISMEDEQGYMLIKIYFYADCPDSWYQVAAVLTIKVWDDGSVEFYPWEESAECLCS